MNEKLKNISQEELIDIVKSYSDLTTKVISLNARIIDQRDEYRLKRQLDQTRKVLLVTWLCLVVVTILSITLI